MITFNIYRQYQTPQVPTLYFEGRHPGPARTRVREVLKELLANKSPAEVRKILNDAEVVRNGCFSAPDLAEFLRQQDDILAAMDEETVQTAVDKECRENRWYDRLGIDRVGKLGGVRHLTPSQNEERNTRHELSRKSNLPITLQGIMDDMQVADYETLGVMKSGVFYPSLFTRHLQKTHPAFKDQTSVYINRLINNECKSRGIPRVSDHLEQICLLLDGLTDRDFKVLGVKIAGVFYCSAFARILRNYTSVFSEDKQPYLRLVISRECERREMLCADKAEAQALNPPDTETQAWRNRIAKINKLLAPPDDTKTEPKTLAFV